MLRSNQQPKARFQRQQTSSASCTKITPPAEGTLFGRWALAAMPPFASSSLQLPSCLVINRCEAPPRVSLSEILGRGLGCGLAGLVGFLKVSCGICRLAEHSVTMWRSWRSGSPVFRDAAIGLADVEKGFDYRSYLLAENKRIVALDELTR